MATYLNKISNINVAEYLCNNENDLADIHIKDIAPGSTAYCIKECKNYILDEDKKWKEFDLENKSNSKGEEESSTKYCRLEMIRNTSLSFDIGSSIDDYDTWYISYVSNDSTFYIPKEKGIWLNWGERASGTISFVDRDTEEDDPFFEVDIDNEWSYRFSDISNFPDNFTMYLNLISEERDPE